MVRALAAAALIGCLPGCYLAQLGEGQLRLLNEQRPLHEATEAEADPAQRALLQLVPDLRRYANQVMQLRVGNNYTSYYPTDEAGINYVVLGSKRTALEAYTWWFPIAGEVPYKGYFDLAEAKQAAAALEKQGYDTYVGATTAYSTLGILRDPITTPMLRRGPIGFVEVLLHEMTHARYYVPGQSDFNEQLASFVGKLGAQNYLRARFGDNSALMAAMEDHYQRRDQREELVARRLAELKALYGSGASEEAVLRRRQPILAGLEEQLSALDPGAEPGDWEMNNARLLQWERYAKNSDYLTALWRESGGSWARFWQAVERYAEGPLAQMDPPQR